MYRRRCVVLLRAHWVGRFELIFLQLTNMQHRVLVLSSTTRGT